MVERNNNFSGLNSEEIDAYIRNFKEFGAEIEVSLLPILDYLSDESSVSSKILEGEIEYLNKLSDHYQKNSLDLEINSDPEENEIYDTITKLIRKSRKAVEYSFLDNIEFMSESPELFEKVELPRNVALCINEVAGEYSHQLPDEISEKVEVSERSVELTGETEDKVSRNKFSKYPSPFHVYIDVLGNVKKSVDFEILKMYDFLCEHDLKEIKSNKLMEIEDEVNFTGNVEYRKRPHSVEISSHKNSEEISNSDLIMNEWASNLRRGVELKENISWDLVNYLMDSGEESEKKLIKSGVYPEVNALLDHSYSGQIPEDISFLEDLKEE
jgi:hypothetical protein